MSRSGYVDDCDNLGLYRGAVRSAVRGKRGQALLRELAAALDAMPVKELITEELEQPLTGMPFRLEGGGVCALGAVGKARGLDMSDLDPEDADTVANVFEVAPALAREIVYMNDEDYCSYRETPAERWTRMRRWVEKQLIKTEAA